MGAQLCLYFFRIANAAHHGIFFKQICQPCVMWHWGAWSTMLHVPETVCAIVGLNNTYICKYSHMYDGGGGGGMQVFWTRNGL